MRRMFLMLSLCLLAGVVLAQEGPQRGRIKKFDAQVGTVTISTPDGKEVEASIVPQTMFRDASNQDIAGARDKGIPAGTSIMFKTEERGGKLVLVGMRLRGQAPGGPQQKADGKAGAKGQQAPPPPAARDSIGVKPLTELGSETY